MVASIVLPLGTSVLDRLRISRDFTQQTCHGAALPTAQELMLHLTVAGAGCCVSTVVAQLLENAECFLRLTRKGPNIGMHYSLTGKPSSWRLVRAFAIENLPPTLMVGIHAQAPFTAGCSATFRLFELSPEPVLNLRSGL